MYFSRLPIFIITIYLVHHLEFSISDDSATFYYSVDDITVNCGSSGSSKALDGREWIGDFRPQGRSTSSRAVHQYLSADPVPYMTVRISRSQFTYKFDVRPGQKFIRLHFYPSMYIGFLQSKAAFSVKAGPYTLLTNFSPSLTADALGVKFFVREFCVTVDDSQTLSITFTPSPSITSEDVYAFINGIEIVSIPTGLYYTPDDDLGAPVIGNKYRFFIENRTALEMVYRLNIGGGSILSVEDLGMFRAWSDDKNHLLASGGASSVRTSMMIKYRDIPTYVAPLKVYQTAWSMDSKVQEIKTYNLTWKLSVDLGFRYLIRLHFCELEYNITEVGQREFIIFINNQMAETSADVIKWSGGNGVAVYKDYIVTMEGNRLDGKRDIIINLKPKPNSYAGTKLSNPFLNGIEIFKLSNPDNNLAGPNPMPIAYASTSWTLNLMKFLLAFVGSRNVIATGLIVILTLVNVIVYQLNCSGANSGKDNSSSREEELCRFSFVEIQLATNNFDDSFVIGNGGFGKVYRGIINRGAKTVAIKRLKLESKQGAPEFRMEIETLSTFQHAHLVSLIGYCDEGREMILVYEYMAYGTLADHLYKIHRKGNGNGSCLLDWEQRLKICIGAARGLDYLHTSRGERRGLIHRDVKSSNILLDKNWVAKISDFGLSKMEAANLSRTHISTAVKGTFGYLDPEYFMTHRLTSKSDVYAFGVVLLEVLCGRPAVDTKLVEEQHSLALWAQSCVKEGRLDQIVDTNVKDQISTYCLKEFAEIANKCLCNHSSKRPTMAEVVAGLEFALEQQGRVYSDGEAADINNEQISKRSPTRGKNINKVDENIVAGEANGTELPRVKKYRGPTRGWRWDSLWSRTRPRVTNYPMPEVQCRRFSFAKIQDATRNFSRHIGRGAFSSLYVGYIDDIGMTVAIKKFLQSATADDAFFNEVKIHSQLRHVNLVPLVGYCYDEKGLFLIYEYIANGDLYGRLHDNGVEPLSWKQRLHICVGAARGLNYLHTGTENRIIHRVVMPHNILLDEKWVPKFSGFGLSILFPSEFSTHCTSQVVGTYGYMAPEYMMTGRVSEKSDVFSFGVVLLEVLSGRKPSSWELMEEEGEYLSSLAPRTVASGNVDQIIDRHLIGQISPNCLSLFVETVNRCLCSNESERPSMVHVLRNLELAHELQESSDAPAEEGVVNLGEPQLDYIEEEESGGVLDDSTEWSLPR